MVFISFYWNVFTVLSVFIEKVLWFLSILMVLQFLSVFIETVLWFLSVFINFYLNGFMVSFGFTVFLLFYQFLLKRSELENWNWTTNYNAAKLAYVLNVCSLKVTYTIVFISSYWNGLRFLLALTVLWFLSVFIGFNSLKVFISF